MRPSFATILDRELGSTSSAHTYPSGPPPDVMLGLSAGIWRALLPVEEPPVPTVSLAQTTPQRPTPRPVPAPAPAKVRWTFAQQDALQVLRDLGAPLPKSPPARQVKRAYWTLARALHPDLNPATPEAAHRTFCRLQAAWDVLRSGPRPVVHSKFTPGWPT